MNENEQNETPADEGQDDVEKGAMEPRKEISLPWEIATLHDAIMAARVLTDALRAGTLDDEDESQRALLGVSAVLSLVGCRMKDLGRVVGGFLDPSAILAPHNEALPELAGEGEQAELRLVAWGPRKRLRRLRAEVLQVRAQVAASKPPKRQREGP